VYISKISLKNIRGFESLDFDLDRGDGKFAGWTVFTGSNGSGKSSLMRAIATCIVGRDTTRALETSFQGWMREPGNGEKSTISLDVVSVRGDESRKGQPTKKPFTARLELKVGGSEPNLVDASPKKNKKKAVAEDTIWSNSSKGWFACGYGPFRRVFGASADAQRTMTAPRTNAWVTLFKEEASLLEADKWMRDLDYQALEGKEEKKKERDILLEILRDDFLPKAIKIEGISSSGLLLKDGNGVNLSWTAMSDGYRAALALLVDILRHMIQAFGVENLVVRTNGRLQVAHSGVVLIDEIDAHLHPEWQREIGFWLKDHFPKVQFLVTTHSPIILQAADPNGLFVLPEPGSGEKPRPLSQEEYQKIIASRPDSILLSPAFGMENTRSEPVVEKRARYSHLQAKKRAGGKLSAVEADECMNLLPFVSVDGEA
jgi:energy-coupling factor transporter ATP-binding protein EcfA2